MIFIPKGAMWSKDSRTRDGRKGYNSLEEALEDASPKCCGFDCKCGVFRLPDLATGETTIWGVSNGELVRLDSNFVPIPAEEGGEGGEGGE
jgi:hypothetical protein